ncbi:hypothetical protein ACHAP7_009537 [Fusarium lateritium]
MDLAIRNGTLPRENDLPLILRAGEHIVNSDSGHSEPRQWAGVAAETCQIGLHSSDWRDSNELGATEDWNNTWGAFHEGSFPECPGESVFGLNLYESTSSESDTSELAPLESQTTDVADMDVCHILDTDEGQEKVQDCGVVRESDLYANDDLSLMINGTLLSYPFLDLDWRAEDFNY